MHGPRTGGRKRRLAGLAAGLALAAAGVAAVPLAGAAAAVVWTREQLPLPGGSGDAYAYGVSCPSTGFCMAVQQQSTDLVCRRGQ
jgi:hypothetical protein